MSIVDKIYNLVKAIEESPLADSTDITIEKSIGKSVKITLRVRPSAESLDFDDLSEEELITILDELERKLEIIQADEPEDNDSKEYREWKEQVEDLEEQIDLVQIALDDLEDEWDEDDELDEDEEWEEEDDSDGTR